MKNKPLLTRIRHCLPYVFQTKERQEKERNAAYRLLWIAAETTNYSYRAQVDIGWAKAMLDDGYNPRGIIRGFQGIIRYGMRLPDIVSRNPIPSHSDTLEKRKKIFDRMFKEPIEGYL